MSAQAAERLARLEALTAGLQREMEQSARDLAERQEERAEGIRKGDLGRDWQDVQRRIDAGQTTLADVFTGADDSPAAQRLLGLSRENIARMAQEMPTELQEDLAEADTQYLRLGRGGIPPQPDAGGRRP